MARESATSIRRKQAELRRNVLAAEAERAQTEHSAALARGDASRERSAVDPASVKVGAMVEHRRYGWGRVVKVNRATIAVISRGAVRSWRVFDIVDARSEVRSDR